MHRKNIYNLLKHDCRVKDHPPIQSGYKARLWCSQDAARKQKSRSSKAPDVKNRDRVGMHRFDCNSSLIVLCRKLDDSLNSAYRIILINLRHHDDHIPYFDVEMPSGASEIICERLEWSTPGSLVEQI